MTESRMGRIACVMAVAVCISGCLSHPVSETPALEGETLLETQRSILTGDELSPTTEQVLNVLDLAGHWGRDPRSTPEVILSTPGGWPDWVKRVACAELYYALARSDPDARAAQGYYLEAVVTAMSALREQVILSAAFDPRHHLLAAIYNRGLEIPANAAALRRQLLEMRRALDPEGDDPAMQDMVVIGH